MKRSTRDTGPDRGTRTALAGRSGGACELALAVCTGRATEVAHRIGRKAGGRKGTALAESNRLSNVAHACHECHMWTHDHPDAAYILGLMLHEGDSPPDAPMQYRGQGWYLLLDDGSLEPTSPATFADDSRERAE
jgi:hypothetical protein